MITKEIKTTRAFDVGVSGQCTYRLSSFYVDNRRLDTEIDLKGVKFVIAGRDVEAFHVALQELVEKYYI